MRQASKPFALHVADAAITDLRARLARTRYPDEPPLPAWSTGTSVAYLESLIDYWQSGFDWRAWEAKLNAFPQFTLLACRFGKANLGRGTLVGIRDAPANRQLPPGN